MIFQKKEIEIPAKWELDRLQSQSRRSVCVRQVLIFAQNNHMYESTSSEDTSRGYGKPVRPGPLCFRIQQRTEKERRKNQVRRLAPHMVHKSKIFSEALVEPREGHPPENLVGSEQQRQQDHVEPLDRVGRIDTAFPIQYYVDDDDHAGGGHETGRREVVHGQQTLCGLAGHTGAAGRRGGGVSGRYGRI